MPELRTTLMGLSLPVDQVPRVMAALRGTYPDQTAGKDDLQAALAVLRLWVTTTLTQWEARQAQAAAAAGEAAAAEGGQRKVADALASARKAADTIG